jgi:hypothetical protein
MSDHTVELQGKTFDLSKSLPLTLGDWEELEEAGIRPTDLQGQVSFKKLRIYMTHVLKKADETVDEPFMRSLTIADLNAFNEAGNKAEGGGASSERPSDSGDTSTSSDNSTDGPQT